MGGINLQPKYEGGVPPVEEIAIQPTQNTAPDIVDRLCEYDQSAQLGCYRTNVIFAFEAEFDTFVHPDMKWGIHDCAFVHEGHLYFYKERLATELAKDLAQINSDEEKESSDFVKSYIGYGVSEKRESLADILTIIRSAPRGMPKLLAETPQFLQFENPMGEAIFDNPTTQINVSNITRADLIQIKSTFADDYNPLISNMAEGLFRGSNGELYFIDLLSWSWNPSPKGKLGVFMDPYDFQNSPYTDDHNFYPFELLTLEQQEFVTAFADVACDDDHGLSVINL